MKVSQVRSSFIEFFEKKEHKFVAPVPVVPQGDKTLLFINAGMNPFKPFFLGEEDIVDSRVANSQKCIRVSGKHNDLEEVGRDTYHHTFFEMLGNWSFGDYYKKEAIKWAWELLTEVWGLDKSKLYATVYTDDDEAMDIWYKETDILEGRVLKFGDKDNFWEMGETGPCGPCSEIHYDLGPEYDSSEDAWVNSDSPRYIEIWNLVFMQYYRDDSGKLHPLKNKHVDTGMGLERIASILQGVNDNYKTDLFLTIKNSLAKLSGKDWDENEEIRVAFRVIMDHIRTIVFAINDSVIPSNEGRGYVIRRILRRAYRFGRKLGFKGPFLYKIADSVVKAMGDYYIDLKDNIEKVKKVIKEEEVRFNKTIDRGIEKFDQIAQKVNATAAKTISGEDVFTLYDTFGFPPDLTMVMAEEKGLKVDMAGYEIEMEKQKERARSASKFSTDIDFDFASEWVEFSKDNETTFTGYELFHHESKIVKYMILDNMVHIVLDKTPFYAESGGQVSDTGVIKGDDYIVDVQYVSKYKKFIVHSGKLEGDIKNVSVICDIDREKRDDTAKNHSATHLLQAALKEVVSKDVTQAGSLVNSEKFRFDFNFNRALTSSEISKVEEVVNGWIVASYSSKTEVMPLEKAKECAVALFDEKYDDLVRVVKVGNVSAELCGGTHIDNTSKICAFAITGESAIASGVRRIEGVTGKKCLEMFLGMKNATSKLSSLLQTPNFNNLEEKVISVVEETKKLKKEIKKLKQESGVSLNSEKMVEIKGVKVYIDEMEFDVKEDVKIFTEAFCADYTDSLFAGSVSVSGKKSYMVIVGDTLVNKGVDASKIVNSIAGVSNGRGGGRKNSAQASIGDEGLYTEAVKSIPIIIGDLLDG